ncbi:hypothetical protein FC70_GL000825 [Paucilactobacillus oligofermentans DSM 15707 = LMG 22743]|uniref:Isochorismatase-like domain-containing protein n=1 Tax=Paucilactobacillus oligofermentans DSM 15707 = LMG 22743 TaxID=1423778 RepID=A0A0R1RDY1_9LACO|nr:cysteine hydrolase family protein [Paucilactobacillus oligofermentans]KRL55229.1 hypothetical protein FC70_GL000825 [Paucilactobacillus oligofermentans DSM 15707 = LMG 22743]CUS25781.1 Isochorismatase family protein [Paucilactobacillus oligofermentans DSM 15707 = LMG 22743]
MMADALLVIDLQNGVVAGGDARYLISMVAKINNQINLYSKNGKPVIMIQHNDDQLVQGKQAWKVIDELQVPANAYFIQKTHANSFYKTNLQELLNDLNIQTIQICGAQVEYCVDTTIKMAHGIGYSLEMQRDTTFTLDNDYMDGTETRHFYEDIWNDRFLTFI